MMDLRGSLRGTDVDSGRLLSLSISDSSEHIELLVESLIIAGFTGRDRQAVQRHMGELAAQGITPPEEVPSFYVVPPDLLTTADTITVSSNCTSGEVEPVLFCSEVDRWYLGVGSDHTARDLERIDILASKKACPKVVAGEILPYEYVAESWDDIILRCWVGTDHQLYQNGTLKELLPVSELLYRLRRSLGLEPRSMAVFLGTVPLRADSFICSDSYTIELADPSNGRLVGTSYRVARQRET
jgi:hypothetical protein